MFKFKNKFKFTSSNNDNSDAGLSKSQDSKETVTNSNLSDNFLKLSINNASQDTYNLDGNGNDGQVESSSSSSNNSSTHLPKSHNQHHNHTKTPSANSNSNSGTNAHATSGYSDGQLANPGLLTIKFYNSDKIKLPTKIINNKHALNALASSTINDSIKSDLIKRISSINPLDDYLPPEVNSQYLPAIVNIPNPNTNETLIRSLLYLTVEFENNVLVIEPNDGTINKSVWNKVVSFDVTKALQSVNSSSNFLNLNLFIRLPSFFNPNQNPVRSNGQANSNDSESGRHAGGNMAHDNNSNSPSSHSTNSPNPRHKPRTSVEEILIGSIKLPLNLKFHNESIRLLNHEYLSFKSMMDNSKSVGDLMISIDFKPIMKKHLTIDDFDLLKVIGKGSFGKVMQVVKKDTNQIYALKTIRKQHIISRMEVTHTLAERTVLAKITNPFIVPLKFSFQSKEKLYLVLSFINGGELFHHLQREGKFSMDRSRFYIAELLSAIESLHELNVIYRDLKPENILLDYQGHIALCDFGLCKLNMNNEDKTNTFCGTPEYLAPELLLNQGYTRSVDWWTLGTLLYEMLTGLPPFYDDDHNAMYRKILQNPLKFPDFLENTDVKDLLVRLLQKDPSKRLNDPQVIKNHPFFKDIDWVKLLNKSYLPPFKPNVENLLDTSNFDQDFTSEKPQDSVVDSFLSESVQKQFGGWTYNGDNMLP